ncbi:MAG TPA: serine/threonine-protein kinase [Polyangiales bacterium]|nr:serine/threonine-protein kinase [Polyangiales bacterium]
MPSRRPPSLVPGTRELIAQRYQTLAAIGGGGMAKVYAVLDTATGSKVALKRPRLEGSPQHQRRIADLFSREYHAMSQLAHPRVVEVYDFGVDADGPYYTMEILDGGDLLQLVPVPYRRLCEISRDVCSALSLLHSRRIVHRDINPRNLRFTTTGGVVKLIDFGAMTAMAPSKEIAGTPAFCAPEVLSLQALDARTDLYALGATMYFALTGSHAYPARDFTTLQHLWQVPLRRPSELVSDVPDALDALVLDLLQLDLNHRPGNAADVIDRLSAIEGRTHHDVDEQLVVAQSYLSTPTFVGRAEELARAQSKFAGALRAHGCVLFVTGARGAGRTRFLEACLLEAKLHGYMGLRADADDAASGDYGVLRRLLRQLQQMGPGLAHELLSSELSVLGHVMPEWLHGAAPILESLAHPTLLRDAVQTAVERILLSAAKQMPLLLAVDDIQHCDEPSLAVLALLSRNVKNARIVILASAVSEELDKTAASVKLLISDASSLPLTSLTLDQTAELLASVFGNNAELTALVQRLHALSFGSPRDLMRLAQHLVDQGLARYTAGAWSLPKHLDTNDFPASVAQLMSDRVASISPGARQLGRALALCPELSFSFAEAQQLGGQSSLSRLMQDVDELTRLEIAHLRIERIALNEQAWIAPLLRDLAGDALRTLHLTLASVLEQAGDPFRQARHLLRAGEKHRAIDVFVAHSNESRKQTSSNAAAFRHLIATLPDDWYETYDEALRACDGLDRPARDAFAIRARLGAIVSIKARNDRVHFPFFIAQVAAASGLTDYARLSSGLDPGTRLQSAVGAASARYEAMPEHDRVATPKQAMQYLAMGLPFMVPVAAPALDLGMLRQLPSVAPLVSVAPALHVAESLRVGVIARVSGRSQLALQTYLDLLARLNAADGGGLEPTHTKYARLQVEYATALLEATMGLHVCMERAERMASEPLLRVNAAIIRMLYALWQGDIESGDRERKHIEELRIRTGATPTDQTHLLAQLAAYAAMDDLTRLKHTLLEISPIAAKHLGWRHVESYGKAEYQRMRGDYERASALLEPWLIQEQAGEVQLWPWLAAAHIRTVLAVGRCAEAVELGHSYLARARTANLGPPAERSIVAALAVAQAKHGQADASAELEAAIEITRAAGTTGIPLGMLYEARAYVALYRDDEAAFQQFAQLCEQELLRHKNPALAARLQRMKREARQRTARVPGQGAPPMATVALSTMRLRVASGAHATERATLMLESLAQRCGASEGILFQLGATGLARVATIGNPASDPLLEPIVNAFLDAETRKQEATSIATKLSANESLGTGKQSYRCVVLSHYKDSRYCVTGIAAFVVKPGESFVYPAEVAAQVSAIAHELGDAAGTFIEDED